MIQPYLRPLRLLLTLVILAAGGLLLAVTGAYQYLRPELPDAATLRDVRLQVPLRVYSRDGRLIAQIGEQRRIPLPYPAYPRRLIDAFLAAEDDRFFAHHGVDYQGLLRAALVNLRSGAKREGGGTITMQLARNIFLTSERSYRRKLLEIFLALRIEREFSKDDILELYLNKIFLGQRAYGVGAAAEVYFGKTVDELDLAETALIAGLPRAPSRDNPVTNPEAASQRRAYVLRRMLEKRFIGPEEYETALAAPVQSKLHGPAAELDAPYVAEMVRADLYERLGPEVYTAGYKVVTTVDSRLQRAASEALRLALLEYDRRHGYRGAAGHVDLPPDTVEADWLAILESHPDIGGLDPAVVIATEDRSATVFSRRRGRLNLGWPGIEWARPALTDGGVGKAPEHVSDVLVPGDIVYVAQEISGAWRLMQVPDAQAAFVALDPRDGAVIALSGGFDFPISKFNRAVQARRQPGSAFKPFIYSAALERGFTPATLVNDAPIVFDDPSLEASWRPQNVSRRFYGPTRVREALIRSRNLVSIRIMNSIGPDFATDYIERFGFDKGSLPQNLTLALGTAQVSPLQMATGYAVFANGGLGVQPYFIDRVEDDAGNVVLQTEPVYACAECLEGVENGEASPGAGQNPATSPEDQIGDTVGATSADAARWGSLSYLDPGHLAPRVISPQNAWIMMDMMTDVVRRGTATRALALKRSDIAGKTGTTNDRRDAWFCGFNGNLVAAAWVGFDQERSLGAREEGGRTALPMWIDFMRVALDGQLENRLPPPPGLVTMRISPVTGLPARPGEQHAIFETFIAGHVPTSERGDAGPEITTAAGPDPEVDDEEPLF